MSPSPPVCCGQLLKEVVAAEDKVGEVIQTYFEKSMIGRPRPVHAGGAGGRSPRDPLAAWKLLSVPREGVTCMRVAG